MLFRSTMTPSLTGKGEAMSSVILGMDVETGERIHIGDIERCSCLYLLGRPGMGKSALSVNVALQDIANGHGLFFLDPHGDAAITLLRRLNPDKIKQAYLFNVEDDDYSFGINLLTCKNVSSLRARTDTYTRAYNVFYKLWEEQWGVWLQLILQNILWAFIENQSYTLADVPMFLNPRNEDFRNHIISNIKYNSAVADFWRYEFFARRESVQQERVEAALTRINTLLTHPYVRDIVGQQKTTIDFENVVSSKSIWAFLVPANLGEDMKKFIGTILLSELVHAVRARREGARDQFCIFVDEFHNFASSDHMATLVTEGRKFGVASTLMHVERFGQLVNNQRLMGATAAIVNKVFFQTTVKDAEEFAPEIASNPPTEKKYDQQFIISQNPVADLMRGHSHPTIRSFTEKYLKPIHRKIDDITQFIRSYRPYYPRPGDPEPEVREVPANKTYEQNIFTPWQIYQDWDQKPIKLYVIGSGKSVIELYCKALQDILLQMDSIFIAIMEKTIDQESFSQAINTVIGTLCPPPFPFEVLQLYISLEYGNENSPRMIPGEFAYKHWSQLVEQALAEQNQKKFQSSRH
jgi:hypothetical protein